MNITFKYSEEVIRKFKENNKDRIVKTAEPILTEIDPQKIIAINSNYKYPEILTDYKMKELKKSVELKGWVNKNTMSFCLLEFPNGDLIVNGAGNHRAVLSKVLSIPSVKAMVAKVEYQD